MNNYLRLKSFLFTSLVFCSFAHSRRKVCIYLRWLSLQTFCRASCVRHSLLNLGSRIPFSSYRSVSSKFEATFVKTVGRDYTALAAGNRKNRKK